MAVTTFGAELRQWRTARGLSQLDLASLAGVSQRHVSFLETGRSRPSREMVMHLGFTLDVPPREQNLLLASAGMTPAHAETALDDLPGIDRVLETILAAHEPNMAIVLDRRWDIVKSNRAATALMSTMLPEPPSWLRPVPNLMRLLLHPDGLRVHMVDWEQTATALLRRLERDVTSYPHDGTLRRLLGEVSTYDGVGELVTERRSADPEDLVVTSTFTIGAVDVSLFTTIAVIGEAHDVTLAELRIETFWPIDAGAEARWREVIGSIIPE
jgi:transcriptional regulator with XRE-family HTH domain